MKFRELENKLGVYIRDFRNIYAVNFWVVSFLVLTGLKQTFSSCELSTI